MAASTGFVRQTREYQGWAKDAFFSYFQTHTGNPIIAMPTGCHAAGARILMHDGTVKLVEDVNVGDQLMGPDSQPRNVLMLARGRQEMRRVVPIQGDPFVVNVDHKLSLKKMNEGKAGLPCQVGRVETVCLRDYETQKPWYRHLRKLRRVGIELPPQTLPVPPYIIGALIGDGSYSHSAQACLHTMDSEIRDEWIVYLTSVGDSWRVSNNGSKASSYYATRHVGGRGNGTYINRQLRALGMFGSNCYNKTVPDIYKRGSREQRLELLAGLIDTDGHMTCSGYEISSASLKLAKDIAFVARSLGLAATLKEHGSGQGNHRIHISGDCSVVPCRLARKQAGKRIQKKDVLCTGFSLEALPEADFYGFELDCDHLYLTDDFTVHHNTGKSVTIADICIEIIVTWGGQRILILVPSKELAIQNGAKFTSMAPQIPVGVCSASLNRYELGRPITLGTIGTIYNRRELLGHIDLVFIDECHLVSNKDETQYRLLADYILAGEMKQLPGQVIQLPDGSTETEPGEAVFAANPHANPNCKFIGLSATPYRLGLGHITDGGLFTDVCFDSCGLDAFNWFIEQGYLLPLIPRPTKIILDTEGVKTSGGDYVAGDLQRKVNKAEITSAAVAEALELSAGRQKCLWFATGIEHAESIVAELEAHGESAVAVHSKSATRDDDLKAFMTFGANGVRHCVNFGVLTTGFDFPLLDCIIMLRPTKSPGLWVQMLGRGTRPYYGLDGFGLLLDGSIADLSTLEGRLAAIMDSIKADCLVLDFAYNTSILGPINDPQLPKKKKKMGGDPPIKTCGKTGSPPVPNIVFGSGDPDKGADPATGCGIWNHPSARNCIQCGAEFTFEVKFQNKASQAELLRKSGSSESGAFAKPKLEEHKVTRVTYEVHKKEGRPDSIRVNYYCGMRRFSHYVLPEHGGNPRRRSEDWWMRHGGGSMPATTNEARARIDQLRTPNRITVWMKKDYPQIMDWIFDD